MPELMERPAKRRSTFYGGDYVTRKGLVVRVLSKSLLFFDDEAVTEYFIPLSIIKDWWFESGYKSGLRIEDLERNDEIRVSFPKWLAKRESLI